MAHAFNDDKGKLDITATLEELKTNFQSGINAIYDALIKSGVTPTAKTPAACIAGINNTRSKTKFDFNYMINSSANTYTFTFTRPYNCAFVFKWYPYVDGINQVLVDNVNVPYSSAGQTFAKSSNDVTVVLRTNSIPAAVAKTMNFEFQWQPNT